MANANGTVYRFFTYVSIKVSYGLFKVNTNRHFCLKPEFANNM